MMWGVEIAPSQGLVPFCHLLVSCVGKELHGSPYICLGFAVGLALSSTIKNDGVLCNEEIKSLLAEGVSSS